MQNLSSNARFANASSAIDAYIEQNWSTIVADIERLVSIPSVEELDKAAPGAPFGPGPRAALDEAMALAERMGFETHDVDGYLAYAEIPGETDTQMGIIGHVDVVPAGPGWTVPPFEVTRKEGYLLGRGVVDDKGPSVVALHALKFWKDQGAAFPCTIRFLFGANEESGMKDVEYYRERHADPAFLFTPDAEFPVCYGEKGLYSATVTSPVFENGVIAAFAGGVATNAVPGEAHVVVRANASSLPCAERITITACDAEGNTLSDQAACSGAESDDAALAQADVAAGASYARLDATGKSAHASLPETGVNAIGLLVDYLLEQGIYSPAEQAFLKFQQKLLCATDGSGLGIATSDEHFGALTIVGGTVELRNGRIVQSIDSRFPTSTTAAEITARIGALAAESGATVEEAEVMEPFLVDPASPMIQALLSAYNEATGENAAPFTMGGGTYARHFASAASFGPEKPWEPAPAWAGSMHGPDEAVSEKLLKQALKIYALTIPRLCEAITQP